MSIREFEYKSFRFIFSSKYVNSLVIIHYRFIHFNLNFDIFDHNFSKMREVFIDSWRIVSFLGEMLP